MIYTRKVTKNTGTTLNVHNSLLGAKTIVVLSISYQLLFSASNLPILSAFQYVLAVH